VIPSSLPLLLVSLSGLLAFFLLIMAALGAARSKSTPDPDNDPRCGACGCIVPDPQQHICSTCGSSLPAVGLVLPFSKHRTTSWTGRQAFFKVTALPLALWTILLVGAAVGATFAIDQWLLPYVWESTSTLQARPRSRGCQSITISTLEEYHARGHAQFDSPQASKTTRVEFKTNDASHILDIDLLAPSYSFTDTSAKRITGDRVPTKTDLLNFMRETGLPTDAGANQDAAILATMLAKLAPGQNTVGSSRENRPSSNLTTLTLNGGQWKTTIPLQTLALWISPTLWFLGFILIIYLQRHRRAELKTTLLTPPLPVPANPLHADPDSVGGWDITLDPSAFRAQPAALQASPTARPR
jgi:hypothetical protein